MPRRPRNYLRSLRAAGFVCLAVAVAAAILAWYAPADTFSQNLLIITAGAMFAFAGNAFLVCWTRPRRAARPTE